MKKYGLIGQSLNHSFSKIYFDKKFEKEQISASYELINLQPLEVEDFLYNTDLVGINVTIPYKIMVLDFVKLKDEVVQNIGVTNCLKRTEDGWIAYNTDYIGFEKLFLKCKNQHQKALIFGTGGTSKTAAYVLAKHQIDYKFVGRQVGDELNYIQLNEDVFSEYTLIINTTPCGMFPTVDNSPILDLNGIGPRHTIIDVIYNPMQTLLMEKAKNRYAEIIGGIDMLYAQAEEAYKIWIN